MTIHDSDIDRACLALARRLDIISLPDGTVAYDVLLAYVDHNPQCAVMATLYREAYIARQPPVLRDTVPAWDAFFHQPRKITWHEKLHHALCAILDPKLSRRSI